MSLFPAVVAARSHRAFSLASESRDQTHPRQILHKVEGHFISGYTDGSDAPDKQLELVPGAVEEANTFLERHPETHRRFNQVVGLIEGFESSFGLELLSTVHWVATKEQVKTVDDVVQRTYVWNERKQQFSRRQIELAVEVLSQKKWIDTLNT